MWYLVLAGLDVAFYASFYLMFTMLLDYYSVIDEQQKLYQDVEELKDLVERSLSNQFSKEQVIDFTKVNINNKIK